MEQSANRADARDAIRYDQLLSGLFFLALDAETGQRGYLLTGDKTYLEPYLKAVAGLPAQLAALDELTAKDDARRQQMSGIKSALTDKMAELSNTINLYDSGNGVQALAVIRAGGGKAAIDQIRESLQAIRRAEAADQQVRFARTDGFEYWLRVGSIAALAAIFLLGLYTVREFRRRIRQVLAAQKELIQKNVALASEIQTREQAESQLRQLQKMEAVGQLTGGIAHDFNNMLAVIISAMNLTQRKLARGESDIQKFIEAATDAATRAANLTARLLAFSRQQPLAPQVMDPNRLVTGMSELLRRAVGESIRIETVLAGGLWKTHADPSQLENALLNLAVNARDAMDEHGKLTIETANTHLDDAYAATHAEVKSGQYVMIAVSDTGTGMSPDMIAKAFEPFFTTKAIDKGTGLGLSQVFGFVKQSGGHVKIYSEPGEGTTVKIYLPRHSGADVEVAVPTASAPIDRDANETILVVEDDERVRAATTEMLREIGYTVIHAGNGQEALRRLAETPSIALMLTDIIMPGMNGRKLAEEAYASMPNLKVIFTTGFTKNAVVHNGVIDPGVHFLAKPFTLEQLALKMHEVLSR